MGVTDTPVLAIDIDGVIILEVDESEQGPGEIFLLHKDLANSLSTWPHATFFVTHRSRREAAHILEIAGVHLSHYVKLIAAEDLLQSALRAGKIREVLKRGLLKSFALPLIGDISCQRYQRLVIIDDRQHNLDAMLQGGAGLALKAPIAINDGHNAITSFDFGHTLASLEHWYKDRWNCRQIGLDPVEIDVEAWQRSGLTTQKLQRHSFNKIRRMFNTFRN